MNISGIQKKSLLDYPDKISTVLFLQGCNFKCGFCHNPTLNNVSNLEKVLDNSKILDYLTRSKKITDAVVITGGEPTLQKDLIKFIKKIKDMNYLIKLDTNGTNPKILKKIIKNNLVDYAAMDVKGPLEKYKLITDTNSNLKNIKQSIKIIIKSKTPHEFRSTILPFWHKRSDVKKMAKLIQGADKYYLQKFISRDQLVSPTFKTAKSYTKKEMESLAKVARKIIGHCEVR
ncbi:anaerobic ribonucleoside-triphosphate reductase activating protein [Patescibacteria group bacterium]